MRDKVVQQSAAEELTKLFDPLFSRGTIAYRPGKSALNAVDLIEKQITQNHYSHALKLDIVRYFENIQWNLLKQKLMIKIAGSDEIELIKRLTMAQSLDHEGNLCEKKVGLYQGSSLSPVLSNVYLMDFDRWLHIRSDFFIRYSDDILVLGNSEDSLKDLLAEIQIQMERLGLILSEEKSELVSLDKDITFLGYSFNSHGKTITEKAQRQLSDKLEMVWIMNRNKPCIERLAKLVEILGGWQQYFRGERTITDILEYAALVYMTRNKEELDSVMEHRPAFRNIYKDLMSYFQSVWRQKERHDLVLLEYEQFTGISDGSGITGTLSSDQILKLHTVYDQALSDMSEESYTELMQLYSDFHQFQKADMTATIIDRIHIYHKPGPSDQTSLLSKEAHSLVTDNPDTHQSCSSWSSDLIDKYLQLFSGREDTYALLEITAGRKSQVMQPEPLSQDVIRKHLAGECIAATYVQRPNGTARFMVIDIDISRKILIQYGSEDAVISRYLKKAADTGRRINAFLNQTGLDARYEFSGFRGYHLWIFFDSWIQVRYLNILQDMIEEHFTDLRNEGEITLEFFPSKTIVRQGQPGQMIKLPLCIVDSSNKRSRLLNDDFSVCDQEEEWINSAPLHPASLLKRALAVSSPAIKPASQANPETENVNKIEKSISDITGFGDIPSSISEVLTHCSLMNHLCRKALNTGYLTHFERQSILYVFGHMVEDGRNFLHQIMGYTLNYQFNTTEKFIRKCPEKPISCTKLRDQYKRLTAEIGCSCIFKRRENCYPFPVLHAISNSANVSDQITLPLSRTITQEKKKEVVNKLNIYKNTQDLLSKIVELKKQKREIDRSIGEYEKELETVFAEAGIERLEIDMGTLVRYARTDGGFDWKIEI